MFNLGSARTFNRNFTSNYGPPVGVFVGGTAGIGQGMVETFSEHTKGNSRVIIIGRNRSAAEAILSRLPPPPPPSPGHGFIQCDVTLMRNVHAATKELLAKTSKINFLVMSPGFMTMDGRVETDEGIDTKLAAHYYARWAFIKDLMPAITKAKEAGEDAKVISVLAAGKGSAIDLDDLGLKKNFTLARAAGQGPTYNDLMTEELAARHPGVTFIHAYPGLVRTNLLSVSNSRFLNMTSPLVMGLAYPFSVSASDCAEYLWSGFYKAGPGAGRLGSRGEDLGLLNGTPEQRAKLWEHTEKEVGV